MRRGSAEEDRGTAEVPGGMEIAPVPGREFSWAGAAGRHWFALAR